MAPMARTARPAQRGQAVKSLLSPCAEQFTRVAQLVDFTRDPLHCHRQQFHIEGEIYTWLGILRPPVCNVPNR